MLVSVTKTNRLNVSIILIASLIPFIFSLLYLFGVRNEANVDLTPLGFLIMGVLVLFGLLSSKLLDFKPFILNSLFDSLPDAILATDLNGNIVSSNPKAVELLNNGIITNANLDHILKSNYSDSEINELKTIEIVSGDKTFSVVKSEVLNNKENKTGHIFHIVDITHVKIYQDELRKSEEQYRILFENTKEGIIVIQNNKLVFYNSQILKLTGYEKEEFFSVGISDLIFKEDLTLFEEVLSKTYEVAIDSKNTVRLNTLNGNICWVEFRWVLIEWNKEKAGLLFINDINEKRQAEELKELLIKISVTYINAPIERFNEIVNSSLKEMAEFVKADRSYIFEYNWTDQETNNTFEWCAEGIQPEIENLQNVPLEAIPFWVEAHKNKLPVNIDNVEELDADSELRGILEPQGIKSLLAIPLIDGENCVGFVGFDSVRKFHRYSDKEKVLLQVFAQIVVNFINRKHDAKMLENQMKVQLLVNKISSELISANNQNFDEKLMIILELAAKYFKVDRSYLMRYSKDATTESNTHEWCGTGISSQKDNLTNVLLDKFPWWKEQILKKKVVYIPDVDLIPDTDLNTKLSFEQQDIKSLICLPIIKDDVLIGYFGFDSTKKKLKWNESQIAVMEIITNMLGDSLIRTETETELIRSKELAEAASVAKTNFLSNMSHEIRTPLNGVIGFTELLRTTPLNKSQSEYLENAITSANSLLGVISDILDFSKIESGKMELEMVKTDIIQLFENASDIIKVMASNKGLELLLNINPDIPRFAYIDPIRTKQILVNLLSNAVKFTQTGEIELSLNFELVNNHEGVFKVNVRDTGIGIKESDRHKLFKAFSQADTSTTRRYGGTGLGLIISNSLARQMGSSIEFKSDYGVGTTFSFDIFCTFECGEMPDYTHIENLKSVLFIDDNANNRSIMELNFAYWKINFTGAQSGVDAFKLLQNENTYDLIIVDYHMPDMDGLETIRLIRKMLEGIRDNQQIIMLHSSSDDLLLYEKAKELNVKYLLTKPVKPMELYYYLNSINGSDNVDDMKVESSSVIVDSDSKVMDDKEICILVAEDTPMNMLVIGNMLKTMFKKVSIIEAQNGIEAINVMKNNKPDIILMDVQMPELDGLEAAREIRRLKNGLTLPIIALTAGVSKEERELCFMSGMDDFISKPIERNELKRVTQKYLTNKILKAKGETEIFSDQSIRFDREKLLTKIGNIEVLASLLEMARTEYPKYIIEIRDAIETGDEQLIKQKAHKIKGSALNMEFVNLGDIAKQIEKNASKVTELNILFEMLNDEWTKLFEEIK
jgi:PAS domain S-box-containing protein